MIDWKKEAKEIAAWIRDYTEKAGRTTLVLGVSGGIDSAVVAGLCWLTNLRTIFVLMPEMVSNPSYDRAAEVADTFWSESTVSPTSFIHEIHEIINFYEKKGFGNTKLTRGNLAARIRANILYDYAGQYNGLVVGTTNLSEMLIGYFTKGGDGLCDLEPIAKYWKSEVYKLGEALGVPESVMKAVSTADLWEGQTDEDEMGVTYDMIEKTISRPGGTELYPKEFAIIDRMHNSTRHKRLPPPQFERRFRTNMVIQDPSEIISKEN